MLYPALLLESNCNIEKGSAAHIRDNPIRIIVMMYVSASAGDDNPISGIAVRIFLR